MAHSRQLAELKSKTAQLYNDSHNPFLHLQRGYVHEALGLPDCSAADAYRSLTLLESVIDPDGYEFHATRRASTNTNGHGNGDASCSAIVGNCQSVISDDYESAVDIDNPAQGGHDFVPITIDEYNSTIGDVYVLLVRCLVRCDCLRDAYEFAVRAISMIGDLASGSSRDRNIEDLTRMVEDIKRIYFTRKGITSCNGSHFDASLLPAQGYAQRILYPWNEHEPDRKASKTLELLNARLKHVAPKCEVRAVALPALHDTDGDISIQLGLFAKEDIRPGEILLRETSLLTATNRLHDDICDACNAPLPGLSFPEPPVPCVNCEDTYFCSRTCHDRAQETYHAAVCGREALESIGKDIPDATDKADYLYLLLLGRALAMSATQDIHPLDLPEVKYIWGDFHDFSSHSNHNAGSNEKNMLPFSFHLTILQPMRLVEEMGLDPFTTLPRYDTWILNTLYAKFRGTASGRLSTWDGGPEVCAVHPLWCLANHSCDPNVRWEWGGEITFSVRGKGERAGWKGANKEEGRDCTIKKDDEILNHYCDIGLDVKERREWARGALGGFCRCERCLYESGEMYE